MGLDAIIGIEYTLSEIPLNFSLDYKPGFHFLGMYGYWGTSGGLAVRYAFM